MDETVVGTAASALMFVADVVAVAYCLYGAYADRQNQSAPACDFARPTHPAP